jgi:chitinase
MQYNKYYKVTELVIKDGYGGAMIWSLALDDFKGTVCGQGKYPLINLIKTELERAEPGAPAGSTSSPVTTKPPLVTTSGKGGSSM